MIDAFDRPGGHILICMALIAMGAALYKIGIPNSEYLITFALGVLARSMMGQTLPDPGQTLTKTVTTSDASTAAK